MRRLLLLLMLLLTPTVAYAQFPPSITISTAGANCDTETNCAIFGVRGYPSIGMYLDVGTSGTFVFEATTDTQNDTDAIWFAITDDINAANTATVDGYYVFTNPGYSYVRLRASAISGSATVSAVPGYGALRTTATLSGASQGDGTILDGVSAAIKATVLDLTNSNSLVTAIVDANGDQITSFGGGTQYATASAQATPTGTVALGWDTANVRALSTNSSGHLNVIFPSAQFVKNQDGSGNSLTSLSVGSQRAITTAIVDASGTQITTFAPTQYANAAAAATPTGNVFFGFDGANVRALLTGSGVAGTAVLRTVEATDSQLSTDIEAIKTATQSTASSMETVANTLAPEAIQGDPVLPTGSQKMLEAKNFDGSALPNTVSEGSAIRAAGSESGIQYVMLLNEDGSAVGSVAQSGTWTMQPGNTANTTPWLATPTAGVTGGCTPGSIISAASVNETQISANPAQLYMLNVTNIGTAAVYFKLYNDTSANTDETDTPVQRYVIPGSATGAGNKIEITVGMAFSTAITFRITSAIADNSTGAIAANEVLVSYCYK
jgi:hypothetical protein